MRAIVREAEPALERTPDEVGPDSARAGNGFEYGRGRRGFEHDASGARVSKWELDVIPIGFPVRINDQ